MDVVHVQHPYLPDFGYQENYLPAAQRDLGHDVAILTSTVVPEKFHETLGRRRFEPGDYEYKGVETRRLPTRLRIRETEDVALAGLHGELLERDPDVLHAHGLVSPRTLQALRYALGRDVRLVVDVHVDNDNFHLDGSLKRALFTGFAVVVMPVLVRHTDRFLPVNPHAAAFLADRLGVPDDATTLLPLGVDGDLFAPDDDAGRRVRADLGVGDDPLVVFAGNVEATKDLDVLVRAATRFDARVLVLGDGGGAYRDRLAALADRLGVSDRVAFRPAVPHADLPDYYNAADVGVWPGKLGASIVEAVATGLPVVVPDTRATSFLAANDNGLTFERGDPDALADTVAAYLGDESLRERHARNAVRYARETLDWPQVAKRSVAIYRGNA